MKRRDGERLELMVKERDELLSSLEDLVREHAAGDLSDEDFERLRRRYVAKTSSLVASIGRLEAPPSETARWSHVARLRRWLGRRRVRRALSALFALWLAAGIALAALHFAGVRLPGQAATGTVSVPEALTVRDELSQAGELGSKGDVEGAIALYARVLAQAPNQPVALVNQGWLVRLTGLASHRADLVAKGDDEIARAVVLAPNYPEAHALDAVALAEDSGEYPEAIGQIETLLSEHPAKSILAPLRSQFLALYRHVRLPAPPAIERS